MNPEHKKYILENIGKKSIQNIARDLGLKERKVKKYAETLKSEAIRVPPPKKRAGITRYPKPLIIIAFVVVILMTAAAFLPSLFNGFVLWDDDEYVLNNEAIRHFSFDNMKTIFTKAFVGTYCPLVMITYSIDYHILKLDPFIYHFTNYILHIITTMLVFIFIYLMSRELIAAFLTALIFGLHPLHVESVAWVSETKDILCALFFMLCLIMYQRYLKSFNLRNYLYAFLFLLLSLFSKSTAVTAPVILLVIDYFNHREINLKSLAEKTPFFIIAFIFAAANMHFQALAGTVGLNADTMVKIYFILKSIPFYLSKLIMPVNLCAIYFYTNVTPSQIGEMIFNAALLAILSGALLFMFRRSREIFFGGAFFIITLLPVLKIIPFGDAFAADRYVYLPSIGIFYIFSVTAAGVVTTKTKQLPDIIKKISLFFITLIIIALSVLTWQRCQIWKDDETLFHDVAKYYPDNPMVDNHLGLSYVRQGDFENAIKYFKKGLSENPGDDMKKILQDNLDAVYKETASSTKAYF